MARRAIPLPPPSDFQREAFDYAVKDVLEVITGQKGAKLKMLPDNASLDDVIAKVNEIIRVLQQ